MLLLSEIEEEYSVNGYQVLTPTGWKNILKIYKTKPLPVYTLTTEQYSINCSGHHLVVTENGVCKPVNELVCGEYICAETGATKVISIKESGYLENLYDITVDSPDGLFYSEGILSHNSTTFCARQLINAHLIPGLKSAYITPYEAQLKTYADRLEEMESMFRESTGKQNLYRKKYANGSLIRLESCLTSANKIRGLSLDDVLLDECVDEETIIKREVNNTLECVKICDVNTGDKIQVFDVNNNIVISTVTDKKYKGIRPCYKFVTETGKELICTKNHKIMTDAGWLYAADIIKDTDTPYRFLCCNKHTVTWENIEMVTYAGSKNVWDITTDKHHTFFANNIGVHNCQGMDPDIVPEILYTQTMSPIKTTVYAGTALTVDTLLEQQWQDSSMGMWHVRAGDGRSWLNMYDKETLFSVCDHKSGPRCPITGKPLVMTNGCFVHAKHTALNEGRIGLHIPQCIIPDITDDPVRWSDLYQKVKRQDPKKTLQECFGIAVSEGSREISERDLMRICTLELTEEELKKRCKEGYYRLVISGCDWGGSDYNPQTKSKTSYTVHCIIGLTPNNTIDILHYRRYAGMDYDTIANTIVSEHKAFNGYAIASDFGVGAVYNMAIRKQLPVDRHFIISYTGPTSSPVSEPKGDHLPNQISVNRTEAITAVFRDIKRFDPQQISCRNWGDMQIYLMDWLNMYRVPSDLPSGQTVFRYIRHATKADDALHAFTFAYVILKVITGDMIVKDPVLERKIRSVLTAPSIELMGIEADNMDQTNYVISG